MLPDRFFERFGRQRPRERVAEAHQVLELLHPGARCGGFDRGGSRFGSRFAALRHLVEHEHDRQDEQRRQECDAVNSLDVSGHVEAVLNGPFED